MDNKKKHLILVLDRLEYKKIEEKIVIKVKKYYESVDIVYTTYETELIRKVRQWKFIGSALQHFLYWKLSYEYAQKIYRQAEGKEILCINPIVAIFLGNKNKQKRYKLTMCGFLFEQKKNKLYYTLRKKFTQKAIKGMSKIIVYGSKEVEYYKKIFGKNAPFIFVSYGIDYFENQKYEGKLPNKFLFSGGGSNRDYNTLLKAYDRLEENLKLPMCIATNPLLVPQNKSEKVIILSDVVVENFGTVLGKAQCLILSLKDIELSAGHMVLLQALAEDIPVIVNRISAVEDYVTEEDVLFYRSQDVEDLKEKIAIFLNGQWTPKRKGSQLYQENYTFTAMLEKIMYKEDEKTEE